MEAPPLHIVLLAPQIPNNTGNIGRTAVATGCVLHLVHPLGFDMDEKALRRAGLDYWKNLDCREHDCWETFLEVQQPRRLWLYTTRSRRPHWNARFQTGDYLLFGSENGGAPEHIHRHVTRTCGEEHLVNLPMRPEARSLNLATTVCAAVYEGLRQFDQ